MMPASSREESAPVLPCGHANVTITLNTYASVLEEMKEKAAATAGAALDEALAWQPAGLVRIK